MFSIQLHADQQVYKECRVSSFVLRFINHPDQAHSNTISSLTKHTIRTILATPPQQHTRSIKTTTNRTKHPPNTSLQNSLWTPSQNHIKDFSKPPIITQSQHAFQNHHVLQHLLQRRCLYTLRLLQSIDPRGHPKHAQEVPRDEAKGLH